MRSRRQLLARTIAIALLAACTPVAKPKPAYDDSANAHEFRNWPDASVDAYRIATTPDAAMDAGVVQVVAAELDAGVDVAPGKYKTVKDALKAEGVDVDGDADAEDPFTIENGILVGVATRPQWCATAGRFKDMCADTPAGCAKASKSCAKQWNYACLTYTKATSGERIGLCLASYSACLRIHRAQEMNDEVVSIGDCVVLRQKK